MEETRVCGGRIWITDDDFDLCGQPATHYRESNDSWRCLPCGMQQLAFEDPSLLDDYPSNKDRSQLVYKMMLIHEMARELLPKEKRDDLKAWDIAHREAGEILIEFMTRRPNDRADH